MPTIRERNGKFNAQVRIKVRGVIVHQESATFATEKQANLWGLSLEKKIANEGFESRKASSGTLIELMNKYEDMLLKLGKPTSAMRSKCLTLRKAAFSAKPLDKITSADIIGWAEAFSKNRAKATVLVHLMAIRAMYRAAPVAFGINTNLTVIVDAMSHLRRLKVSGDSTRRDRRLLPGEMERLQAACKVRPGRIPMGTLLDLLVAFPRRREEVVTMLWSDYDEVNHTMFLRDTKDPTGHRDEKVPVPPLAQAILAKLPRKDPRVVPFCPEPVSNAFRRLRAEAGIEDLHLHDLRHEGISRLFEMGLQIPEVRMISGHKNWSTLQRYTHIKHSHVLDKLNDYFKREQENSAQPTGT